jgi:predicted O-linked N-acetylglucosamine transferase (SPINDLY family)
MDYRLTTPLLDGPPGEPAPYTEAPLVLPDCYWCYDPLEFLAPDVKPETPETPARKSGHVTFGSQNSFHKLGRETLGLWARVLRALPESRLVMHAPPEAAERVLAAFERDGVERARVKLLPRRARADYLRAFGEMDLCLDSIPFNGATTTLDALFMGTPTLTRVGSTAPGRAAMSILTLLDFPELVTRSDEAFVARAVELGSDLGRLEKLRASARERLLASPLMDAPRFVRHLEAAYRDAFRAWCRRVAGR